MYYTDRQMEIMEFLQRFFQERNTSPTLEEVAQAFGVTKVTIHGHLKGLEERGAIRRTPHLSRAIEILDTDYLPREERSETSVVGQLPVQVLGRIAAGQPIEAVEGTEQVDLAELLPMGKDHYALRVRGTSMIGDGIHDGDLVIVEHRTQAIDGEMVVAIVQDSEMEEATLKKMYHEEKDGEAIIRLQPSNPEMEPIFAREVEVRGVVVGVVRKYPGWPGGLTA